MEERPLNPGEAVDPLRLDRCPDCGYLLTGLPAEGLCPECGFAYNAEMIVLYGWAGEVRRTQANQRPGRWLTILVWVKALLIVGVVWYPFVVRRDPTIAWMASIITLIAVHTIYRRHRLLREGLAPVQLRLFPDGFAQRDGIGGVRLRPWRRGRHLRVQGVSAGRINRVRSYRWYHPASLGWWYVDFMFRGNMETVARIQERIDRWRRERIGRTQ
jgi:hypothetical protein